MQDKIHFDVLTFDHSGYQIKRDMPTCFLTIEVVLHLSLYPRKSSSVYARTICFFIDLELMGPKRLFPTRIYVHCIMYIV